MNKHIRNTIDWIQLPFTLLTFLFWDIEESVYAKVKLSRMKTGWRENIIPVKVLVKLVHFKIGFYDPRLVELFEMWYNKQYNPSQT